MMDNETLNNGVVNGDSSEFADAGEFPAKSTSGSGGVVDRLNEKIDILEREKIDLEKEKSQSADKIGQLEREVEALRSEQGLENRAINEITKRAFDLEGQVVRLEHDLITAMNAADEARREADEMAARVAEAEMRERSEKNEREAEIDGLRREKEDVEGSVGKLEALLKESEAKVMAMAAKLEELVRRSEESDKLMDGLKEKVAERKAAASIVEDEIFEEEGLKLKMKMEKNFPLIGAVSAGALVVATVGVCYLRYRGNR